EAHGSAVRGDAEVVVTVMAIFQRADVPLLLALVPPRVRLVRAEDGGGAVSRLLCLSSFAGGLRVPVDPCSTAGGVVRAAHTPPLPARAAVLAPVAPLVEAHVAVLAMPAEGQFGGAPVRGRRFVADARRPVRAAGG